MQVCVHITLYVYVCMYMYNLHLPYMCVSFRYPFDEFYEYFLMIDHYRIASFPLLIACPFLFTPLVWPISHAWPQGQRALGSRRPVLLFTCVPSMADGQGRGMLLHCLLTEYTTVQNWLLITPQLRYFIPTQLLFSTEMMHCRLPYLFSCSII